MKYIFLIAFSIFSVNLYAQENNSFLFTFNHQALPVSDLQKTGDFYVTILGFKEIEVTASQTIPKRWVQNHEGKQLHLITSNDGAPNTIINHMAFSTSNCDTFVKHLKKNKITYQEEHSIGHEIGLTPMHTYIQAVR